MKVYKVIGPYEVEKFTRDGWALETTIMTSQAETIKCDTPVAIQPGCQHSNNYGSGGNVSTYRRDEAIQVHLPMFLLSKAEELLTKEDVLEQQVAALKKTHEEAVNRSNMLLKNHDMLEKRLEEKNETLKLTSDDATRERELRRKLESDLNKVRIAIGSQVYDAAIKGP